MSWTELFPVMDEGMVDEFLELATAAEKAELEEWYGVKEVFNARPEKGHVLAFSLFWKPSAASKKEYPTPTREILMNAGELGLELRFEPWSHYIEPALKAVPGILEEHPDVTVRVYLAADLEFLIEDFVDAGCEVCLMRHPSIAHAPGVAWRLLALGDKDRLVTVVDSDRLGEAGLDIGRTEAMARDGLGAWRMPVTIDADGEGRVLYRPFIGCQMGCAGGWPVERLLQAFTWQTLRGAIPHQVEMPGCGMKPAKFGEWPDFGFEEWFLTVVMYPRMAGAGMLTFVPSNARSLFLSIDLEYATWANPASQMVVFAVAGCCGPAPVENDGAEGPTPTETGDNTGETPALYS